MRIKDKKTFELSTIKKYRENERRLWRIPLVCLIVVIISTGGEAIGCLRTNPGIMTMVGVMIWFLFGTVTLSGIPYLVGKTRNVIRRKIAIQNCTITNMGDFDYYRDKLTGISPASISILTDLEIEQKKDVAASVLQYENLGLLVEEADQTYHVTEKYYSCRDLNDSDRYLIEHLVKGDFDWEKDTQWKEMAMNEAFSDGYITRTTLQPRIVSGSRGRYFVKIVLVAGWICWLLNAFPRILELRPMFEMDLGTDLGEHLDFICSQPQLMLGFAETMALFIAFMFVSLYNPRTHKKMHSDTKKGFVIILVWLCLIMIWLPVCYDFNTQLEEASANENYVEQIINTFSEPEGILPCFIEILVFVYTMCLIAYVVAVMSPAGADIVKSVTNQIRRTDYGNQMAECIYGMKNFIHDYSNLNSAEKQQVVLWEDYLVYAVVLEENEEIVREISRTREKNL